MNKVILTGLRDLKTDYIFQPQREYQINLIAERISEEKMDTFSDDDPDEIKYRLKISHIDEIIDLRELKQVKFEKGKSPSQKLRFLIEQELGSDEYEPMINYLMGRITGLCDDYRERK